ncbi:hypothetical protein [Lysobacter gummosus]|uniref:hypothetical protein n=1 Tax=Lysobacter gummosus TaxID=262324 RepID=UPI00363077E0
MVVGEGVADLAGDGNGLREGGGVGGHGRSVRRRRGASSGFAGRVVAMRQNDAARATIALPSGRRCKDATRADRNGPMGNVRPAWPDRIAEASRRACPCARSRGLCPASVQTRALPCCRRSSSAFWPRP